MGQPITHPTKSGLIRRHARAFKISREATRPCDAIIKALGGREIGAQCEAAAFSPW